MFQSRVIVSSKRIAMLWLILMLNWSAFNWKNRFEIISHGSLAFIRQWMLLHRLCSKESYEHIKKISTKWINYHELQKRWRFCLLIQRPVCFFSAGTCVTAEPWIWLVCVFFLCNLLHFIYVVDCFLFFIACGAFSMLYRHFK